MCIFGFRNPCPQNAAKVDGLSLGVHNREMTRSWMLERRSIILEGPAVARVDVKAPALETMLLKPLQNSRIPVVLLLHITRVRLQPTSRTPPNRLCPCCIGLLAIGGRSHIRSTDSNAPRLESRQIAHLHRLHCGCATASACTSTLYLVSNAGRHKPYAGGTAANGTPVEILSAIDTTLVWIRVGGDSSAADNASCHRSGLSNGIRHASSRRSTVRLNGGRVLRA